jgi:hypothetical protein
MSDAEERGVTARVFGVTIHGPQPVGAVDLRLEPGVDVLYGLNGVGKSRMLAGLSSALGGRPKPDDQNSYFAWVQIEHGGDGLTGLADDLVSGLLDEWPGSAERDPASLNRWDASDVDVVRRLVARALVDTLGAELRSAGLHEGAWLSELAWDLACSGLLGLARHPMGAWQVYVAASVGTLGGSAGSLLTSFSEGLELLYSDASNGIDTTESAPPNLDEREAALWPLFLFGDSRVGLRRLLQHEWAPVPVFNLGALVFPTDPLLGGSSLVRLLEEERGFDVDLLTGHLLEAAIRGGDYMTERSVPVVEALDHDTVHLSAPAELLVGDIESMTNTLYGSLLIDAPWLQVVFTHPDNVLRGGQLLRWMAQDAAGRWLPLRDLSSAQRRWAEFSIKTTLSVPPGSDAEAVLILDEPELALHPTAQRFLARGLRDLTLQRRAQIMVASHSPALLEPGRFRLHKAYRDADGWRRSGASRAASVRNSPRWVLTLPMPSSSRECSSSWKDVTTRSSSVRSSMSCSRRSERS